MSGIVRIEERAAPLAQVGFVRLRVDAEIGLFLQRVEFGLARVLVERQFGVVHRAAQFRLLDHLEQLLVRRRRVLDLEEQAARLLDVALVDLLLGVGGPAIRLEVLRVNDPLDVRP